MSVFRSETIDAAYEPNAPLERRAVADSTLRASTDLVSPTIDEIMLDVFVVTEATDVVPTLVALDSKSAICSATLRCLGNSGTGRSWRHQTASKPRHIERTSQIHS